MKPSASATSIVAEAEVAALASTVQTLETNFDKKIYFSEVKLNKDKIKIEKLSFAPRGFKTLGEKDNS